MTARPTRDDTGVSCFAPPPAGAETSRVPDEVALARLAGVRVAEAMVTVPDTLDSGATVAEARDLFTDDHLHMLLIVEDGRLLGAVVRDDLGHAPDTRLLALARLEGRTIAPEAAAADALAALVTTGRRRLAVVDPAGRLLGLLCLKRSGLGFCSDADVAARAREQAARREV